MDQIAMFPVNLEDIEAGSDRAGCCGPEGVYQILDLGQRQLLGHRRALAFRHGARPHGLPRRLGPSRRLQWGCAIPGPRDAPAPARMADLNSGQDAEGYVEIGDALQPVDLAVFPDARAAMGDAALAGNAGGLDEGGGEPAGGEAAVMGMVPILHP